MLSRRIRLAWDSDRAGERPGVARQPGGMRPVLHLDQVLPGEVPGELEDAGDSRGVEFGTVQFEVVSGCPVPGLPFFRVSFSVSDLHANAYKYTSSVDTVQLHVCVYKCGL